MVQMEEMTTLTGNTMGLVHERGRHDWRVLNDEGLGTLCDWWETWMSRMGIILIVHAGN